MPGQRTPTTTVMDPPRRRRGTLITTLADSRVEIGIERVAVVPGRRAVGAPGQRARGRH